MFENITHFFKKFKKSEKLESKSTAKERLHLVLAQDRANISADFLEMMKQEILEVIKKYIDIDEKAIDVRLTNKENADGTNGAPALYANIPILNIKNEARKITNDTKEKSEEVKEKEIKEQNKQEQKSKNDQKVEKKEEVKVNKEENLEQNNEKQEEKEKKANDNEEVKQEEKVKKEDKKEVEKEKEKIKTEE